MTRSSAIYRCYALLLVGSLVALTACSSESEPTPRPTSTPVPIVTAAVPQMPDRGFDRYDVEFIEAFGGHEWERPIDIAFLPDGGMLITVWHPFVSGRLARMRRVAAWIEALQKKGGVWFATMDEIARHVRTCIDDGSWTPRVEQMPYYDGRIPEWEPQEVAAAAE